MLIVVIFACRKDFSIDNEAHQPGYLTEAKDFYYKQSKILGISAVSKQKSTSNGKSIAAIGTGKIRSITPLWYKSYLSKAGDNEFTEVPIASDEKMISVYNFAKKPQDEKINLIRANSSFKRLLIYRTKKQNFHQLQLTYVPDYDYLERNHFDASKTQINKLGDFSGYIEYSSVKDEKPIFILRFEKGKFISKYYFGKKNVKIGKGTLKVGGIEIGVKGWGEVCTPKYGQVCVLAGDPEVEHCGPMMVVGEDCEMVYTPDPDPDPDPDPVIDCDDPQYFWLCDLENPDPNEQVDCNGDLGGSATPSLCGCIGGNTGISGCEPKEIIKNVKDSCIKEQVTLAITAKTEIGTMLNTTFGGTDPYEDFELTIRDTTNLANTTDGEMQRLSGLAFEIRLNQNTLPNYSKEYMLATVYHEVLHAYFEQKYVKGSDGRYQIPETSQHETMANGYLDLMASALQSVHGLNLTEAKALAWGGLQETNYYTKKLTQTQRDDIEGINAKHRKKSSPANQRLGTYCNK